MSLVRSTSLTLATRGLLFALSLATNLILARMLGPDGRGIYAIAVLVPSIITLLASLGIGPANVYHVSRGSLEKRYLVSASLWAALLLGGAAYGLLALVMTVKGGGSLIGIKDGFLLVSGTSIPFSLATPFMQGVLQGERRFRDFNAVLLCQYLLLTLLLFLLLLLPVGRLGGAVAAWTVTSIITGVLAMGLVVRGTRLSPRAHWPTVKEMLRFGSLTYLGNLTSFINYRFDLVLVNVFSGAAQVGLYAVGSGLAEVIWFLPNSAAVALAPTASAAPPAESAMIAARVTRAVLAATAASAVLLAAIAPFAIRLFFGAAFESSAQAVWLLLPGIVTFSAWKIMSTYLLGRSLLKADLLAAGSAMVATLVLDLLLIPGYGFRGAAVASSIAYSVAMLIDLGWVLRHSRLPVARWLLATPADVGLLLGRLRELRSGTL